MYRVVLSPESRADLRDLRDYIARKSSEAKANNYLRRIRKFYEGLSIAPHRGEQRFHLRPGLRSIGFERRTSILFAVSDEKAIVEIPCFYYGGRAIEPAEGNDR